MRRAAAVLLVLACALPACGRKGLPVAPQLVEPEAVENLAAIATPDGVRLSWLRPTHYTGGGRMNDLGGFEIERARGEGPAPEFVKIGTVTLEDQQRFRKERRLEWVDKDVQPGERYRYRVTAVTLDRYRSAPAGPVSLRYGNPPSAPSAEPPSGNP
jgi:hypothetical protein